MRKSRNEIVRLRASETLLARGYGLPTAYVETTSSLAEEIDKIIFWYESWRSLAPSCAVLVTSGGRVFSEDGRGS
jgi:hypothetical protein